VQREQQPDPVGAAEAVDEQVRRLRDPVAGGGAGQLDPRRPVDVGQQRLREVAGPDEPGRQVVQGLSWAVLTGTAAAVPPLVAVGAGAVTVTFWVPE
jgi:hypothetical protein